MNAIRLHARLDAAPPGDGSSQNCAAVSRTKDHFFHDETTASPWVYATTRKCWNIILERLSEGSMSYKVKILATMLFILQYASNLL